MLTTRVVHRSHLEAGRDHRPVLTLHPWMPVQLDRHQVIVCGNALDHGSGLPQRQATAVIESVTAHDDLVSVQLYGHPWVTGEYWPMIASCFQVRAVDDTGGEHEGVRGSGGGSPEGSFEFWFWPPVAPAARQIRVIVSTLWEAAWAEIDIPGRPA